METSETLTGITWNMLRMQTKSLQRGETAPSFINTEASQRKTHLIVQQLGRTPEVTTGLSRWGASEGIGEAIEVKKI